MLVEFSVMLLTARSFGKGECKATFSGPEKYTDRTSAMAFVCPVRTACAMAMNPMSIAAVRAASVRTAQSAIPKRIAPTASVMPMCALRAATASGMAMKPMRTAAAGAVQAARQTSVAIQIMIAKHIIASIRCAGPLIARTRPKSGKLL